MTYECPVGTIFSKDKNQWVIYSKLIHRCIRIDKRFAKWRNFVVRKINFLCTTHTTPLDASFVCTISCCYTGDKLEIYKLIGHIVDGVYG